MAAPAGEAGLSSPPAAERAVGLRTQSERPRVAALFLPPALRSWGLLAQTRLCPGPPLRAAGPSQGFLGMKWKRRASALGTRPSWGTLLAAPTPP